jgi:intracellular sulfur oxidation DsrE/DsrF family protein
MNCAEAARLLNAYTDDELELPAALAVQEHLESCARCRRSFAGLQAVRGAIARSVEARAAPQPLRETVHAALSGAAARRPWAMFRSPLAVAAPGLVALALAGWLALAGLNRDPAPLSAQTRIVYHISSSDTASAALRNLGNHLQASPDVKIVVVAHNNGVDFLLRGARDESDRPYEAAVKRFRERGVEFRVCYNTLERRQIASSEVIPQATLVPSGIAEIGRLQSREGYVYMRL